MCKETPTGDSYGVSNKCPYTLCIAFLSVVVKVSESAILLRNPSHGSVIINVVGATIMFNT
jgi:hypothetical protein